MNNLFAVLISCTLIFSACAKEDNPILTSGDLTLSFNNLLHTKIDYTKAKNDLIVDYQPSEKIRLHGDVLSDFKLVDHKLETFKNEIGQGNRLIVIGDSQHPNYNIRKKVIATAYQNIRNLITTQVEYQNKGEKTLDIKGWNSNQYSINSLDQKTGKTSFWSFQTGTYPSRTDWILPLNKDFEQTNYQGMNASDYGGGTPVADVWRPDAGIAVGHLETEPHLISLPVKLDDKNRAQISVHFDTDSVSQLKQTDTLPPEENISTIETFVSAHTSDYYASLQKYRKVMDRKGIQFTDPPETAYEPIWCAWGYGRNFTLDQVLNTLPKVKELGFEWAVLDDGWQIAEGEWQPNSKFDDTTIKEFVDQVHRHGLKAKLWWVPLAADPTSRIHDEKSEMLLINKKGNYQDITWWDSHYLNPALESTKAYHYQLVEKFIGEWGFDGLKIDGQHLNQVPPDYGHSKDLKYPEKSVEELPILYKGIYETATDIKSDAVVEICPCGASASSFIMPYMNQPVSSDPLSSWQIRHKGKTFKAIMGESAAYYGDHVELSDNQKDFASTVGIGGVIGTKFTWPEKSSSDNELLLTDKKEELIKKWMDIYKEYMLPKGTYRGELYDIGFDKPEAHVIERNDALFYSFYSDSYEGKIELRGLKNNSQYQLTNYETGNPIEQIEGSEAQIKIQFDDHLMIKAKPVPRILSNN